MTPMSPKSPTSPRSTRGTIREVEMVIPAAKLARAIFNSQQVEQQEDNKEDVSDEELISRYGIMDAFALFDPSGSSEISRTRWSKLGRLQEEKTYRMLQTFRNRLMDLDGGPAGFWRCFENDQVDYVTFRIQCRRFSLASFDDEADLLFSILRDSSSKTEQTLTWAKFRLLQNYAATLLTRTPALLREHLKQKFPRPVKDQRTADANAFSGNHVHRELLRAQATRSRTQAARRFCIECLETQGIFGAPAAPIPIETPGSTMSRPTPKSNARMQALSEGLALDLSK